MVQVHSASPLLRMYTWLITGHTSMYVSGFSLTPAGLVYLVMDVIGNCDEKHI